MNRKLKASLIIVITIAFLSVSFWYLSRTNIPVLQPAGPIGLKERNLIYFALGLSLIVVIPVFTLLIAFAVRYRESNTKAKYSPNLDHNRVAETIWWLIPSGIIVVLAIVAWNSSHTLDPFRTISSNNKTINIQVIALNWKWLFIYPNSNVASLNYFQIPVNTPINFDITSDAPMNSFWIPQLGGQIYAMPGMSTQLNLLASRTGLFNGLSANISGEGFSGMTFKVRASSYISYSNWINHQSSVKNTLSEAKYNQLTNPSVNNSVIGYSSITANLFNTVINKYMVPSNPDIVSGNTTTTTKTSAIMNGMVMR